MFKCFHSGGCCEDPITQINLTLGDVKRLVDYTKKSALQLYKEGIIGLWPFSGPGDDFFELDIGLFIPCMFRRHIDDSGFKKCSCYDSRPLNCRLFPYWILAELPKEEIERIKEHNVCLKNYDFSDFDKEQKVYIRYKEHLAEIFHREVEITEKFMDSNRFKRKIKLKEYNSRQDYRKIVNEIVSKLKKEDFSEVFKKIDDEITKHKFVAAEDMKEIDDFVGL